NPFEERAGVRCFPCVNPSSSINHQLRSNIQLVPLAAIRLTQNPKGIQIIQPRVDRTGLPWVTRPKFTPTPKRVAASRPIRLPNRKSKIANRKLLLALFSICHLPSAIDHSSDPSATSDSSDCPICPIRTQSPGARTSL